MQFPVILPKRLIHILPTLGLLAGLAQEASADSRKVVKLDLVSDYLPHPVTVPTAGGTLDIHRVVLRGECADGTGAGVLRLDPRPAELNPFGDVVEQPGPEPGRIAFTMERATPDDRLTGWRGPDPHDTEKWNQLFELSAPSAGFPHPIRFKLGSTESDPHRLLIYTASPANSRLVQTGAPQVILLRGTPSLHSALPDRPWSGQVNLAGLYRAIDDSYHRIQLQGSLSGPGKLTLDINYWSLDAFGEPAMSTLMGISPHDVTLNTLTVADPLGLGRRLVEVRSSDPNNVNRVVLVLGPTEAAAHRLLLYEGDRVGINVPVVEPDRERLARAAAQLENVSVEEQEALEDLRRLIGYDFLYQCEEGRITELRVLEQTNLSALGPVLGKLRHLRSLKLTGELALPGLPALAQLPELIMLELDRVQISVSGALDWLRDLRQLENFSSRDCTGLDDRALQALAGFHRLRFLTIEEQGLRRERGTGGSQFTEAGLAVLAQLHSLEFLRLSCVEINDASLEHLVGLPNLREVHLSRTPVSLAGTIAFARRKPATSVRTFNMSASVKNQAYSIVVDPANESLQLGGYVDEPLLQGVTAWPSLKRLKIEVLSCQDHGLLPIADLHELESLNLGSGRQLTDAGLVHLEKLSNLRELSLRGCRQISDAGLIHLVHLSNLRTLDLQQTRVTKAGVERLQKDLPQCAIEH